jgi:uncharacterized protein YbaP (TraB family)
MKNRKWYYSFGILSLFITLSSFLWKSNQIATVPPSLLWKIEGNGLKQPSYLFGTMHMIEKQYFYFPESLEKLVKKSDLLVMEIAGIPNQAEAMKYLVLKEGTFYDFFTPQQMDTIFAWTKAKMMMDEKAFKTTFSKFKPFVLVQTATQMQFMGKTESYEMTFQNIANKNKVKQEGLETIADQMKIFDDLTKEQQAEMVMEGIRDEAKSNEMSSQMQQIYRRQQIDSLYNLIQSEGGVLAAEQNAFLDNRNKNWIPKIKNYISQGKTFIAVGAAHLGGENGVIRLLEKEGFTVTPVKL